MDILSQYLEITTHIITILGVPTAIYVYLKEQKKQREEREYGTFDALDDKYIEIQQLCLGYPELDIFDSPFANAKDLSEEEKKQEEAILLIRISIFERAFLMYQQNTSKGRKGQWDGWKREIIEWFSRSNFTAVWEEHAHYFDKDFFEYFNRFVKNDMVCNNE